MLQTTHDQSAVQRELETVSPQETLALVVGFIRRQYLSSALLRFSASCLVWFT